jgi:hypothetical protein
MSKECPSKKDDSKGKKKVKKETSSNYVDVRGSEYEGE